LTRSLIEPPDLKEGLNWIRGSVQRIAESIIFLAKDFNFESVIFIKLFI
jgi:hypothetical protein